MRRVGLTALRLACCDDWGLDQVVFFPLNAGHVRPCHFRSIYAAYAGNFEREHGLVESSLDHRCASWEQHM
jgi:hypothetical protein